MRIAYYRVSTGDQSIESQRFAMGGEFYKEFKDEGVSGGVLAMERPGFAKLMEQARRGDTVCVYAVDRLGRDALDVQGTVRRLNERGIAVDVHGLGAISGDVGELILAVLAQLADMERRRIKERTQAGLRVARASLEATGLTHRGKESLGRPRAGEAAHVTGWRRAQKASIQQTAAHFGLSLSTVKRYGAQVAAAEEPLNAPEPGLRSEGAIQSPLAAQLAALKASSRSSAHLIVSDGRDPLEDL